MSRKSKKERRYPPKVSICIPTYNRAAFIGKTLGTLLNQTFSDFEIIVCDDGSTDNTHELIACIGDDRLHYIRNPFNLGLYENWNNCINLANGEYIAVYHDHDLYERTIVEESKNILDLNERVGFVFTAIRFIDDCDNVLETIVEKRWQGFLSGKKLARKLATRWDSPIGAPTVMVRKKAYESVGLYEASLGFSADLDMWVRLLLRYDCYYINRPMASLRIRTSSSPVTVNFGWKDVKGSAKIHKLNIDRLYANHRFRYVLERLRWYFKRDREYCKCLAWCIVKGKNSLVDEGKETIANESLLMTRILSYIVLFNPASRVLLRICLPIFRLFSWIRLLYFRKIIWKKI